MIMIVIMMMIKIIVIIIIIITIKRRRRRIKKLNVSNLFPCLHNEKEQQIKQSVIK